MNTHRPAPAISLIGAPTDIGAGARGASMGPEALRVAGLQAALEGRGLQVDMQAKRFQLLADVKGRYAPARR